MYLVVARGRAFLRRLPASWRRVREFHSGGIAFPGIARLSVDDA